MTTILTYRTPKKVYMVTDTESGLGDNIRTFAAKKSYKIGEGVLIAISGDLLQGYKAVANIPDMSPALQGITPLLNYLAENTKGEEEKYASFVVATKDCTYYVAYGGYCPQSEPFLAMGSGCEIAYGAYEMKSYLNEMIDERMFLGCIMDICMKRNPGTGGETNILELDL